VGDAAVGVAVAEPDASVPGEHDARAIITTKTAAAIVVFPYLLARHVVTR
jgi:hypothetical protein